MSSAVPPPARSHGQGPQPTRPRGGQSGAGPAGQARPEDRGSAGPEPTRPDDQSPHERLVALGVVPATARALLSEYGTSRVVDALDAVDTLGDGEVRRRAGWVVSAIREGWELDSLLAERRALEARYARWERERAERDRADARWRAREAVAGAWRGAISAALDDRQLATAVDRVTSSVAGLGRRSLPIVRAQLLAWAVTAHVRCPDRLLADVLADDLVGVDRTVTSPPLEGALPPPPGGIAEPQDDLTARLAHLLAARPDLARPAAPGRETPGGARAISHGEGVGHDR